MTSLPVDFSPPVLLSKRCFSVDLQEKYTILFFCLSVQQRQMLSFLAS